MASGGSIFDKILWSKSGCRKRRPNQPKYSANSIMALDINRELEALKPSERLLDYYRSKIEKFDEEFEHLRKVLDSYQKVNQPTFLENERLRLSAEVVELRSALSDVNVFIYAERQQVTRHHAENERLQLDLLEAEKKIALLLSLSGLSETQLKVFLRDPRKMLIIKQKLPLQLKKLNQKLKENQIDNEDISEVELSLHSKVSSLEKQICDSEVSWAEERATLLEERSLATSEFKAQRVRDEGHMKLLMQRLDDANYHAYEATKDAVQKLKKLHSHEKLWLAERDHLLTVLASVQEKIPFVQQMNNIERSGSYTDLIQMKPQKNSCETKELRRENEMLQRELEESEEYRNMYESQCVRLEQEMCKLREQKEAAEEMFKERIQKQIQQNDLLRKQSERLDERRRTDVEGFHSDIRLIKDSMKTLVHQIYKITIALTEMEYVPPDFDAMTEIQAVSSLARTVQKSINDAKRKIIRLDHLIDEKD
ncbi:unnamed protein product, partial [Meganyctiphanes norvegica]